MFSKWTRGGKNTKCCEELGKMVEILMNEFFSNLGNNAWL